MIFIEIIILSVLAGLLYHLGGTEGYNTKIRDLGVPTIMILMMILLGKIHWSLIPSFLLLFASLTTYYKKKNSDAKWYNWALVGLFTSMSIIPFVICYDLWYGFIVRIILCTILITISSTIIGDVLLEEFMRGYIIISTIPILFNHYFFL